MLFISSHSTEFRHNTIFDVIFKNYILVVAFDEQVVDAAFEFIWNAIGIGCEKYCTEIVTAN